MIAAIERILAREEVLAMREAIAGGAGAFSSGAETAGRQAAAVKNNEQMDEETAAAICEKVRQSLMASDMFLSVARPKRFARVMVSRYRPGMAYGLHVDDAIIEGMRTDLSFTLFLSDPETYTGGELKIAGNDADSEFKLPAGHAVVYPSTSLHEVLPVTAGERLAVVGWVRSHVRDGAAREILFDLDLALAAARNASAPREQTDRLLKVKMNLLRRWIED